MRFVDFSHVVSMLRGKRVAIVGSGPSALECQHGAIDNNDVVIRVNNYGIGGVLGNRTDVFYSFFGGSIKKTKTELISQGVKLCMCKCPNSKPIESAWHETNNKLNGIDFRYLYLFRKNWWFCDTFVPTDDHFLESFKLLDGHIPTTGFSAILDVVKCNPSSIFITGFDFFQSGIHNVNKVWKPGDPNDPIGHRPMLEFEWLLKNKNNHNFIFDEYLSGKIDRS